MNVTDYRVTGLELRYREFLYIGNPKRVIEAVTNTTQKSISVVRGTGFEPANTYVTGPSTLRL